MASPAPHARAALFLAVALAACSRRAPAPDAPPAPLAEAPPAPPPAFLAVADAASPSSPSAVPTLDAGAAALPGYDLADDTVVAVARSACFGACPVYVVGLRGDGTAHFYGEAFTATRGYATANVGRPAVTKVLASLARASFVTLPAHYAAQATDHPGVTMLLRQGRAWKRVERDTSHEVPALEKLEAAIEAAAPTARWVGHVAEHARGRSDRPPPPMTPAQSTLVLGPTARAIAACAVAAPRAEQLTLRCSEEGAFGSGGGILGGQVDEACLERALAAGTCPLPGVGLPDVPFRL